MTTEEQFESLKKINDVNVDRLAKICELTGGGGDAVAQVSALKDWKESSMREWRKADIQKIGQLLAIPIGAGVMENLQPRIEGLLAERDQWKRRAEEAEGEISVIDFAKEQATNCASCGEFKHTPWRSDVGYVCATCIENEKAAINHQLSATITDLAAAQAHAVMLREAGGEALILIATILLGHSSEPYEELGPDLIQSLESARDLLMKALPATPAEELREHDLALAEKAWRDGYGAPGFPADEESAWQASETRRALEESAALNPTTP